MTRAKLIAKTALWNSCQSSRLFQVPNRVLRCGPSPAAILQLPRISWGASLFVVNCTAHRGVVFVDSPAGGATLRIASPTLELRIVGLFFLIINFPFPACSSSPKVGAGHGVEPRPMRDNRTSTFARRFNETFCHIRGADAERQVVRLHRS